MYPESSDVMLRSRVEAYGPPRVLKFFGASGIVLSLPKKQKTAQNRLKLEFQNKNRPLPFPPGTVQWAREIPRLSLIPNYSTH